MYIKSIELDGFKSYQKHVEIAPFSPRFNAITGYNGSGKSNVLDSICFLLGITKLDAVRAKSMSELIAHGGTKATVQIRFDNTNKNQSPFGMENYDEITVLRTIVSNGRSCTTSYHLNGHSAPNSKMTDFFRGVGLNVNNPHFLIMQGRITTVLNMKPEEILGMVEEAAGTKMYDHKKKEAEKTMFVKEVKLKEIDNIFDSSIDPRMDKFREDRKNMIEVTRLQKMRENSKRKADAFEYYQAFERSKSDIKNLEDTKAKLSEQEKSIAKLVQDTKKKEEEKAELEHMRDHPDEDQTLEEAARKVQDASLRCEQEEREVRETIDRLASGIELREQTIENEKAARVQSMAERDEILKSNAESIDAVNKDEEHIQNLRAELETITRGTIANDKGEHVSVESAIQDTRSAASVLDTKVKTATNRRDRIQAQVNCLKEKTKGMAAKSDKDKDALQKLKLDADHLTEEIRNLDFDHIQDGVRRNRHDEIGQKLKVLKHTNDEILERACSGRFAFNLINPPTSGFDYDRDVEGLLVYLVKLKPQFREYHQAVDIALGGLYGNIVVRDQETARLLIEGKSFTGRRTLIPVSENGRSGKVSLISDSVVRKAQTIADKYNENVLRLIDMIDFPARIDNTFRSAIGSVLVVQSLDCAREVAFADGVRTRVLTGRGDDVKTTGVMSGGTSERGEMHVITGLEGIHKQLDEIAVLKNEQKGLTEYMATVADKFKKFAVVNSRLQEAERKLAIYQNNIKSSDIGRAETELENLNKQAELINAEIDESCKQLEELKKKIQNLEARKNNDKNELEKRKAVINKELKQLDKKIEQNTDVAASANAKILRLGALITTNEANVINEGQEIVSMKAKMAELKKRYPGVAENKKKAEADLKEMELRRQNFRNEQRNVVDRIAKLQKEMTTMRKQEIKANADKDDTEKEITRLTESEISNKKYAASLAKKHEWLVDEQPHFNKKGGLYDFENYSTNKGSAEIKELTDKIEKLERSLCMKNVANLDSCEAKVIDIRNKRAKLHEDFDILKKTIAVLDKKKTDELERAHQSVNRDFGKIFNCLLPDATAELVPPEGRTVCQGLEVKVAFNGIVKESLHELSGGQRSLVALSLILAMLKFKPAPLYILDEVDAALDLSHTANIGKMIKAHFNDNQFIIVSLKQGMFSNAECLFQTHFVDGRSDCKRLTGAELDAARNDAKLAAQADELEDAARPNKKAAKKPTKKPARGAEEEVDEMA